MERGRQASDAGSSTRHNQGRRRGKPSLGDEAGCRDFKSAKGADPRPADEGEALRILPHEGEPGIGRAPSRGGDTVAALRASFGIHWFWCGLEAECFPPWSPVLQEGHLQALSAALQVRAQTRF